MDGDKLFSDEQIFPWKAEWKNMPEYSIEDLEPKYQVIINFSCASDVEALGKLVGQNIKGNDTAKQLQSFWFPVQEIGRMINKRYIGVFSESKISNIHSNEGEIAKSDDDYDVRCVVDSLFNLR